MASFLAISVLLPPAVGTDAQGTLLLIASEIGKCRVGQHILHSEEFAVQNRQRPNVE